MASAASYEKWSSTTTPATPISSAPTPSPTRNSSWPSFTPTAISSKTASGSVQDRPYCKMMDGMANHVTRVRKHIERISIDPRQIPRRLPLHRTPHRPPLRALRQTHRHAPGRRTPHDSDVHGSEEPATLPVQNYMDTSSTRDSSWKKNARLRKPKSDRKHAKSSPPNPCPRCPPLPPRNRPPPASWRGADILTTPIIRDESYYFAPQGMTKVMNEGWATHWHATMMTRTTTSIPPKSSTTPTTTPAPSTCPQATSTPTKSASNSSATSKTAGTTARHGKEFEELDTLRRCRPLEQGKTRRRPQKNLRSPPHLQRRQVQLHRRIPHRRQGRPPLKSLPVPPRPPHRQIPHHVSRDFLKRIRGIPPRTPSPTWASPTSTSSTPTTETPANSTSPSGRQCTSTSKSNSPSKPSKASSTSGPAPSTSPARIDDDIDALQPDIGKQSQQHGNPTTICRKPVPHQL